MKPFLQRPHGQCPGDEPFLPLGHLLTTVIRHAPERVQNASLNHCDGQNATEREQARAALKSMEQSDG